MLRLASNTHRYRLGRTAYLRTNSQGWLLFSAFLIAAGAAAWTAARILPTYSHAFTPYVKWQDALVALCCCVICVAGMGCVLCARFLYALRAGRRWEMLALGEETVEARDLSHENLLSIFWLLSTELACCGAALLGLLPEMLLAWTLHLPSPLLAVCASGVAVVLSIAGLALTLPALSFVVIGLAGNISFCRDIGSPRLYRLSGQASLSIERFVLTIIYPDAPEALIDLALLDADDARQLLHLLRERWQGTQRAWYPRLGDEIEAALADADALAGSVV
jgi:hypothetical protein